MTINITCDHGKRHASIELALDSLIVVYAGVCECGGDPAKCKLPQITCVECNCESLALDLVSKSVPPSKIFVPATGKSNYGTYIEIDYGELGKLREIAINSITHGDYRAVSSPGFE